MSFIFVSAGGGLKISFFFSSTVPVLRFPSDSVASACFCFFSSLGMGLRFPCLGSVFISSKSNNPREKNHQCFRF